MSWTFQSKNSASYSNQAKNTASYSSQDKSDSLSYILTDALDYVLVGSSSDEFLIWRTGAVYAYQTKN